MRSTLCRRRSALGNEARHSSAAPHLSLALALCRVSFSFGLAFARTPPPADRDLRNRNSNKSSQQRRQQNKTTTNTRNKKQDSPTMTMTMTASSSPPPYATITTHRLRRQRPSARRRAISSLLPLLTTLLPLLPLLLLLLAHASPAQSAEDSVEVPVPTHKAARPLMKPRPALPKITHRVYLTFAVVVDDDRRQQQHGDGKERTVTVGRLILGLFGDAAPQAAENFRRLCECDGTVGRVSGRELCYRDSVVHRIVPNFLIQGGDITHADGTGGESVYGGHFPSESAALSIPHDRRYLLGMANHGGRNANGSQFYINLVKTRWLDGKNVVLGTVLDGSERVLTELQKWGRYDGTTRRLVKIVDSGLLPM